MASRGGRGGASKSSITNIGTALGVDQSDMRQTPVQTQPPQLYPVMKKPPLAIANPNDILTTDDYEYIIALKQEFLTNFRDSPYYFTTTESSAPKIERYTDRLKRAGSTKLELEWLRYPAELRPGKRVTRKKILKTADFDKLEEIEAGESNKADNEDTADGENAGGEDEEDEGKAAKKNIADDKLEAMADEEQEGDEEEFNDYATNYFDNGEDYGEADSGDNLDEDAVF